MILFCEYIGIPTKHNSVKYFFFFRAHLPIFFWSWFVVRLDRSRSRAESIVCYYVCGLLKLTNVKLNLYSSFVYYGSMKREDFAYHPTIAHPSAVLSYFSNVWLDHESCNKLPCFNRWSIQYTRRTRDLRHVLLTLSWSVSWQFPS